MLQKIVNYLSNSNIANLIRSSRQPLSNRKLHFVLSHVSEDSVLPKAEELGLVQFAVAGRERYATCSGVAWLREDHLAVVNLYGQHLRIYKFDPGNWFRTPSLKLLHELKEGLAYPENLAISADGNQLAITHSMSHDHGVSRHTFISGSVVPSPDLEMISTGYGFHGLTYSPDGKYLVYTNVDQQGYIEVISTETDAITYRRDNPHEQLKLKDVVFTDDGKFLIIVLAPLVRLKGQKTGKGGSVLAYRFDSKQGIIEEEPIAQWQGESDLLNAVEGCSIMKHNPSGLHTIFAVNQASDSIMSFHFDVHKPEIRLNGNIAINLSFPHGVDVRKDGKYLAVANYGDDTVRIARL